MNVVSRPTSVGYGDCKSSNKQRLNTDTGSSCSKS